MPLVIAPCAVRLRRVRRLIYLEWFYLHHDHVHAVVKIIPYYRKHMQTETVYYRTIIQCFTYFYLHSLTMNKMH